MDDPQVLAFYAVADRLGKSLGEVMALPEAEVLGWLAYLNHIKSKA